MKCQNCGTENPKDERFCGYCGRELLSQVQQPAEASWLMIKRTDGIKTAIIVAFVAAIILIAVIAVVLVMPFLRGPHLEITNWDTVNGGMFIIFAVNVSNTGGESESATVLCTVTFDNGDSYSGTQEISLDSGESDTYGIAVTLPVIHWLDMSGKYSCTLS